jgi:hypothetical protein
MAPNGRAINPIPKSKKALKRFLKDESELKNSLPSIGAK